MMFNSGRSSAEGSNRFVCPSDRQLALRAKLRTGWSQKSSSSTCGSTVGASAATCSPQLNADEQSAIVAVLKRAELVEQQEQQRVGRLLERLQNLRRHTVGEHLQPPHVVLQQQQNSTQKSSHCSLCSERFGLFRAKRVECQHCGSHSVCQQCAISVHNNNRRPYLCLICAETREFWKKSGAWFFKSLPNYLLHQYTAASDAAFAMDDDGRPASAANATTLQDTSRYSGGITRSRVNLDVSETIIEEDPEVSSPTEQTATTTVDNTDAAKLQQNGPKEQQYGYLEISLHYNLFTATLHCNVYRAKNLLASNDLNASFTDPFCQLTLLPTQTSLRTKTVHRSRHPEFNEKLSFTTISETDLNDLRLHIVLFDNDEPYGWIFLGEATVNHLARLRSHRSNLCLTVALEPQQSTTVVPAPRGQILLSLCYSTKRRALLVGVLRCRQLAAMDANGLSDPFVKLRLKPDPHHRKWRTTVKWKNLNPVFNEEFTFETRPTELGTQRLYVEVFDKDYGKPNDYLGGLILGGGGGGGSSATTTTTTMGAKGPRLKHWLDMVHYPDRRHEMWHNLCESRLN